MSPDPGIKRILVISHEPEKKVNLISWCLKRLQTVASSELHLITVLPELDYSIKCWLSQKAQSHQLEQRILDENRRRQFILDLAESAGVKLFIHVCFGKLFYDSIQYARFHQIDLVVKMVFANPKHQNNLLFDSQDMHLLRKCPMPLLLYKQDTPLPFSTVMASVDVNLDEQWGEDDNVDLNQQIFQWSQWLNSHQPVHIAHAWEEGVEFYAKHCSVDLSEQEFNELIRDDVWTTPNCVKPVD